MIHGPREAETWLALPRKDIIMESLCAQREDQARLSPGSKHAKQEQKENEGGKPGAVVMFLNAGWKVEVLR
jgi:hypothetical protein